MNAFRRRPDGSPLRRRRAHGLGWAGGLSLFACLVLCGGCSTRPRAPALLDEAVYHNAREGFRFLVPEGWSQQARSELPPGKVEKERLLVSYRFPGASSAMLEVSLADFPEPFDLTGYLEGPSFGSAKWKSSSPPAPVKSGDHSGLRFLFTSKHLTKDVLAFRRGERVYCFTGLYATADTQARSELRRATDSLIWER